MNATKQNIRNVLGVHAQGLQFVKKINPTNGYVLKGFLSRDAIADLTNNFHIYQPKQNGIAVITPGRLRVSQRHFED